MRRKLEAPVGGGRGGKLQGAPVAGDALKIVEAGRGRAILGAASGEVSE